MDPLVFTATWFGFYCGEPWRVVLAADASFRMVVVAAVVELRYSLSRLSNLATWSWLEAVFKVEDAGDPYYSDGVLCSCRCN